MKGLKLIKSIIRKKVYRNILEGSIRFKRNLELDTTKQNIYFQMITRKRKKLK